VWVHAQGFGQLAYGAHARAVYFVALQAPDMVPMGADLIGQLLAG
jgi:hypothetical protein